MDLAAGGTPPRLLAEAAELGIAVRTRALPTLAQPLPGLTALNLADNNLGEVGRGWGGRAGRGGQGCASRQCFLRVPARPPMHPAAPPHPLLLQVQAWLVRLGGLEVVDLSGNFYLEARQPLTPLLALKRLRWLDLRAVHVEHGAPTRGSEYWSQAKCVTMQHLAALAKAVRRRRGPLRHAKILHDTA
jgi:hypothetical protein